MRGHRLRGERRGRGWSFLENLLTSRGGGHSEAPTRDALGRVAALATRGSGALLLGRGLPQTLVPRTLPLRARGRTRPMHVLPCADGAAGVGPTPYPDPLPASLLSPRTERWTRAYGKLPGLRNRHGPRPGVGRTAQHRAAGALPGPGDRGPAPRPAPPRPLYKKKRQHLPLDTPGGRGALARGGRPVPCTWARWPAAPRVLRAAQRCRGLGWPLW